VHGRREDDGQRAVSRVLVEQVVGQAVGGAGQQVGRGRGDDDEVGVLADAYVRHLVDVVPHVGGDRLARQRPTRSGADEAQRRAGRARR
jgi:hypothetical protein